MISFTFDDFPRSALTEAGAILKRYNIEATYYVSMGLMGQLLPAGEGFSAADLRQVIAEGHELGCHTFSHCHSWKTKPHAFEKSVMENKSALSAFAPGSIFESLSYPIAYPRPATKRRVEKHFLCCRCGGNSFNAGIEDANSLQAVFLEKQRGDSEALKQLIKKNAEMRGWLIFATHDVTSSPSSFGCTPEFFETIIQHSIQSAAKILPVAKAWAVLSNRGNGKSG